MDDHHIFNHFDNSGDDLTLVPECRSVSAQAMAGFTCGTDPTLEEGTLVIVPNVPKTGYTDDERQVTILREGHYKGFYTALEKQCPSHGTDAVCDNIEFFKSGCASTRIENDLVVFEDAFDQQNCMPKVTDHNGTDSWVEEHKIVVGYDDLIRTLPGGLGDTKLDIHKVYEISCNIRKIGEVVVGITTGLKTDNEKVNDTIGTNFYIEKHFGDITDVSTRRELNETEVIPFSPNADPNERFQFKVWSDHNDEYVHLESCKLTLEGNGAFEEEFINDGCVTTEWQNYFANENRETLVNEDWFNMRPLLIGCKSKWHIDCTVASCKRDLEQTNYDAFEAFCKADEECKDRYTAPFMGVNARKRRSPDQSDENPAEDHVEINVVHPCYYVDEVTTEYCVDQTTTCWTLEQCTAAFPNDFPNSEVSELDEIMKEFKEAVQEHIDEILSSTESPINTHDQIMESIRENASRVVDMKQTFDDAVDEIIRLIQSL